jgi:biopolymer transport protein ExbD
MTAMMDMMTIVLVFLLKSYSSSTAVLTTSVDVQLPLSTTRASPRDTVAVTVTSTAILVGHEKVVTLNGGALPPEVMEGRLIRPLSQALRAEVDKLKYLANKNGTGSFPRELSVIGDRQLPYELLMSVLYTARHNELENFRFVVLQKE